MNAWKYLTNSTLKREYAFFLTVWLLSVATYLVAVGATDMQFRILELFAYPVLVGAFGVFGLDWVSKQTSLAGPPQPGTVTTTSVDTVTTTADEGGGPDK